MRDEPVWYRVLTTTANVQRMKNCLGRVQRMEDKTLLQALTREYKGFTMKMFNLYLKTNLYGFLRLSAPSFQYFIFILLSVHSFIFPLIFQLRFSLFPFHFSLRFRSKTLFSHLPFIILLICPNKTSTVFQSCILRFCQHTRTPYDMYISCPF